jgi:hypothetical protein
MKEVGCGRGSEQNVIPQGCIHSRDIGSRVRLYLISVDADYYILALDAAPASRGLVLPRPPVGLISGALAGNQQ